MRARHTSLAVVLALILLVPGALIAASLLYGGLLTVRVEDRQDRVRVFVPVPGALLEGGAFVAARLLPSRDEARMKAELARVAPALRGALAVLEQMPDAVLVRVDSPRERVLVEKRGGALRIEVADEEARVAVSLPVRSARRSAAWLLGV